MIKFALKDKLTGQYYLNPGAWNDNVIGLGDLADVKFIKTLGATKTGITSRLETFHQQRSYSIGSIHREQDIVKFAQDRVNLLDYGMEPVKVEVKIVAKEVK